MGAGPHHREAGDSVPPARGEGEGASCSGARNERAKQTGVRAGGGSRKTEEKMVAAVGKLDKAATASDDSERAKKVFQCKADEDEKRITSLEKDLKEAREKAEADATYDEVAKKLAQCEADLEEAEERAEVGETKIVELEEELRVVANNLKSLEVAEEKANQREKTYKEQIKSLTAKLKQAEARAEFAEKSVQKLQKEVDRLEDELVSEQEK